MARTAHGVLTRRELLAAGLSRRQIEGRIEKGVLIPVHRGVYRVGHSAPSTDALYLAAVKAGGEAAILSGRAAEYLFALTRRSPPPPEITAPVARRIPGVRTRRARLHPMEVTRLRGIPVTTVPRTLVDLAARLSDEALSRACHEAGVRYGTTPRQVEAVLIRHPTSPGAARLRSIARGDIRVTLSRLESEFLRRLQEVRLPLPETNRQVGGSRVDCCWPEHRLTVEIDSYRFHNSRHSWEGDRRREREARRRGDEFRRYTWTDVREHPEPMLAELTALLCGL